MSDIIALDVSKNHSYCVWYRKRECLDEFNFTHDKPGFKHLLAIIKQADHPIIYFEATNVYSRTIQRFCEENRLKYAQLNPLELHLKSESLRRYKTDEKDVHRIALTAEDNNFRLTTYWNDSYSKLREQNRFLNQILKDIKLKQILLYTALQQTFPEEEQLFSNFLSKLALNVILLFPHPDCVKNISRTRLKNQLMKVTDKKISKEKALKHAETLMNYAQNSTPATEEDSVQVEGGNIIVGN